MNKRFFIFVFAMSSLLFVFNHWVFPQKPLTIKEPQVIEKPTPSSNTISLDELPGEINKILKGEQIGRVRIDYD